MGCQIPTFFRLFAVGCLLAGGPLEAGAEPAGENSLVLTNAAQIRSLTVEEAARHPSVSLQGVAVLAEGGFAVLVDGTAGIYLEETNGLLSQFHVGDVLSAKGVADPGHFAPILKVTSAIKTGTEEIPRPAPVAFPKLQTGRFDAQWIEVSGVVRRSTPLPELDLWELRIFTDGGQLPVRLSAKQGQPLTVDSEIRLRGVCFYQFNKARQVVGPVLQIPGDQSVFVTLAAPPEPFAVAERAVSSLMQFSAEDLFTHRVRVSGVVTHAVMGEGFWIRSGGVGLRVRSLQNQLLAVGDRVDVLGFLSRGEYSPVLEDAIFRKLDKAEERPVPLRLADSSAALNHDEDLVQLDAQMLEQWRVQDGCRLTLKVGNERFHALLRFDGDREVPQNWLPDSRVRITGICSVTAGAKVPSDAGTVEPGAFQILLRSPSDITILEPPPWWTPGRVGWLVAGLLGLLLSIGGVIFWRHRLRVARQMALMKAQAALAAERTRIARDLHDEIGANLTHISIVSTLASEAILTHPQNSKQHCVEAASVAQQTIRAFDEILWSVNPKNDTLHSLSHYICRYAEETLGPAGIIYRFKLDESFPNLPLPPNCRHGLLLAVKEALHNVIKHAGPKQVEIICKMETNHLFLVRVTDDGCGMDMNAAAPANRRLGQGLENLRRRSQEMGGECLIESQPGKGTQVTFRLPL